MRLAPNDRLNMVARIVKEHPGLRISELARRSDICPKHATVVVRELGIKHVVYTDMSDGRGMKIYPLQQL